jgi:hypothetical protein
LLIRFVLLFIFNANLSGCFVTKVDTFGVFDPEEAKFIHDKGTTDIKGQAFLRRKDGIVVYAAGSVVELFPVTTYSQERKKALYGDSKYMSIYAQKQASKADPRYYDSYTRKTKANGQGEFVFKNVGKGEYYILTSVSWQVGDTAQGGALIDSVVVSDESEVTVVLSGF